MPKILIVDDESDVELLIRQQFRRKIRDGTLTFEFALNGEEALHKLSNDRSFDVVMSDINMPVMDGLTLLSRLREMPDRLLRTVVVSAYGDMQNIRVAMNRGAYDFLTKPIDFADFEITLQKTLDEVRGIREGHDARQRLNALEHELAVAARIQQSMLPRKHPPFPDRKDFQVFAQMEPARSVGGDFYDYFPISGDRFGFVCGDVSGKGVPSALFMASTRTLLRATAKEGVPAAECIRYVNTVLSQQGDETMFVTLLYGILDMSTGELDFCNAGHMYPYLIPTEGPIRQITDPGGMIAGFFETAQYQGARLLMSPGDCFVMYTDGVTEAYNPEGDMFEISGLEQSVESGRRGSVDDLVKKVMSDVRHFASGEPQSDDITVLAIRYLGPPESASGN